MNILRDYIRLGFFAIGLLVGIQVPSFVDQYHKRVDAHYSEAKQAMAGYQETADKHFMGDMERLIAYYEASDDPVFKDDAVNVKAIFSRVSLLNDESLALQGAWYRQVLHVALHANANILEETIQQYSYTVPLNRPAIAWGVTIGLLLALLMELFYIACYKLVCIGLDKMGKRETAEQ
jgi:hypothetical protein